MWQNRIIATGEADPEQLLANPLNFRIHPRDQQEALEAVLDEVGWVQDVIVNAKTNTLIDGHLRVKLALRKGETSIPVKYVELSEQEEVQILAAFDPVAAMAATDKEKLAALFAEIDTDNDAMNEFLAGLAEREGIEYGDEPAEDPGAQIDKAEELREKWGVESGQLWKLGEHRVIVGDCTDAAVVERLMEGERADVLFTDPPYGVNYQGGGGNSIAGDTTYAAIPLMFSYLDLVIAEKGWLYICGGSSNFGLYAKLFDRYFHTFPRAIVWDQGSPTIRHNSYHSSYELIFFGYTRGAGDRWYGSRAGEGATDVWRVPRITNAERTHLTEKPVELPQRAIENSCPPNGSVGDLFLGTGATLIACENLNQKCYGAELEPKYVGVTLERWATMTGDMPELIN